MATATLKRKHGEIQQDATGHKTSGTKKRHLNGKNHDSSSATELQSEPQPELEKPSAKVLVKDVEGDYVAVQIVAGSYDRVLHGVTATIPSQLLEQENISESTGASKDHDGDTAGVTFSDTFLFAAHASAIRCLALSPPAEETHKRYLATGSTDERINLYTLSTSAPPQAPKPSEPKSSLLTAPRSISESSLNRPLGSLNHHSRPITSLSFPTKSKLLSTSEDSTLTITRTRDWTPLSTLKAPIPKPSGRPSGDTLAPGEVPAGVNHVAVHPSQKLAISVGRGERVMRLWNLMTGKKAGVLNFEKDVLAQVGEGKIGTGEGRRVVWCPGGEAFVVGFERGAVVYGVDSRPRWVVRCVPERTKVHQMRFLPLERRGVLAVSTEDGRICFFEMPELGEGEVGEGKGLPVIPCVAELGGKEAGVTNRIKDFEVLELPPSTAWTNPPILVVTANSDGTIRIWSFLPAEVAAPSDKDGAAMEKGRAKQIGKMLGIVETGNRITCLGAFVMDAPEKGSNGVTTAENGKDEANGIAEEESSGDDEEDNGEEFAGLD